MDIDAQFLSRVLACFVELKQIAVPFHKYVQTVPWASGGAAWFVRANDTKDLQTKWNTQRTKRSKDTGVNTSRVEPMKSTKSSNEPAGGSCNGEPELRLKWSMSRR